MNNSGNSSLRFIACYTLVEIRTYKAVRGKEASAKMREPRIIESRKLLR
jgi:hypothetical protein